MINPVESKIIERFKQLLSEKVHVWEIILFGSRARGDADPDSDMDILVVLNGKADKPSREAVSDCAWEAGFDYGVVIVPVVYSRDEWENGPERSSLLSIAINREGIAI